MNLVCPGRRAASAFAILAIAAIFPTTAGAADLGFGTPRVMTPAPGAAYEPSAAVAPNGRTVVLYAWSAKRTGNRASWRALLGPDPDHLAGPVNIPLSAAEEPQVFAERDGTIVICETRTSGKAYTLVCTLAPPTGSFGRPRTVARVTNSAASRRYGHVPSFHVIALGDGRLVVSTAQTDDGRSWRDELAFAPAGTLDFGASRPVADSGRGALTPLAGGGLLFTDVVRARVRVAPLAPATLRSRRAVLTGTPGGGRARVLAAGASAFAPPTAFPAPGSLDGVDAGPFGVAIRSYVYRRHATPQIRATVQGPAGVGWTSPAPVRPVTDGFVFARVLLTREQEPLAISSVRHESETDCGQQTLGRVAAGPLGSAHAELLSDKHQVANLVDARVMDDGTIVVFWTDSARTDRVEYATRPPAARRFSASHPLPFTGARDLGVAGNGRRLIATWTTASSPGDPSRLIIATSRTTPPYSPDAPRPSHPSAPCN